MSTSSKTTKTLDEVRAQALLAATEMATQLSVQLKEKVEELNRMKDNGEVDADEWSQRIYFSVEQGTKLVALLTLGTHPDSPAARSLWDHIIADDDEVVE